MKQPFMLLRNAALATSVVLSGAACKSDRADDPEETRKVIEETKDEAAEARADIQSKQEELARGEGDVAAERAEFIAETEKTLAELDRKIQELRADVQQSASATAGEAKADVDQGLADLEATRRQAQSALDKMKQTTSDGAAQVRQETESALERTRNAYDALRGRVGDSEDPEVDLPEEPGAPLRDVK